MFLFQSAATKEKQPVAYTVNLKEVEIAAKKNGFTLSNVLDLLPILGQIKIVYENPKAALEAALFVGYPVIMGIGLLMRESNINSSNLSPQAIHNVAKAAVETMKKEAESGADNAFTTGQKKK